MNLNELKSDLNITKNYFKYEYNSFYGNKKILNFYNKYLNIIKYYNKDDKSFEIIWEKIINLVNELSKEILIKNNLIIDFPIIRIIVNIENLKKYLKISFDNKFKINEKEIIIMLSIITVNNNILLNYNSLENHENISIYYFNILLFIIKIFNSSIDFMLLYIILGKNWIISNLKLNKYKESLVVIKNILIINELIFNKNIDTFNILFINEIINQIIIYNKKEELIFYKEFNLKKLILKEIYTNYYFLNKILITMKEEEKSKYSLKNYNDLKNKYNILFKKSKENNKLPIDIEKISIIKMNENIKNIRNKLLKEIEIKKFRKDNLDSFIFSHTIILDEYDYDFDIYNYNINKFILIIYYKEYLILDTFFIKYEDLLKYCNKFKLNLKKDFILVFKKILEEIEIKDNNLLLKNIRYNYYD